MKWIQRCLRNQLTIYLLAIAVVLFGLFCLSIIPIAPGPALTQDQLHIELSYPGANADTMQTQVTSKVENALLGMSNIHYMTAFSQPGYAEITLTLESATPNDLLQTQIQIMQAIAASHLPAAVQQPTIVLGNSTAGLAQYIVYSDELSLFDIDNFIQAKLTPKFSSLPGVTVRSTNSDPVVKIQLKPEKLAEYQLSTANIASLLDNINQSNPLGQLYLAQKSYVLNSPDSLHSLKDFGEVVVGYQNQMIGQPVLLKQIADIDFTSRSLIPTFYNNFNGHTAESVMLLTRSSANPFQVVRSAQQYINSMSDSLPKDMKIISVFNRAKIMADSFRDLLSTVGIAAGLVLLIALMFLGHFRTTIIPIITIPICLFAAIIVSLILGMSLNSMTLFAMVIGVGLVVDDAIVVVENITRHLEEGFKKADAVLHGSADIAKTIIGITLTLLAVYLPIAFCTGPFITVLKAFTIPLAVAVLMSGVVALTLTPVMCTQLISDAPLNRYQAWFAHSLRQIIKAYHTLLLKMLKAPVRSLILFVILIVFGSYFALGQPEEFLPADPDNIVNIIVNANSGDDVSSLKKKLAEFSSFYLDKKVDYYDISIQNDPIDGFLQGQVAIQYHPQFLTQDALFADQINQYILAHHLQNTFAKMEKWSNWGNGFDLSFEIYGGSDVNNVDAIAQRMTNSMQQSGMFTSVTNTIQQPKPQLQFNVDDVKAAKLGIERPQIMQLLSTAFGGYTLNNYFNIAGLNVPIVVQLNNNNLQDPNSIQKLNIQNLQTGQFYPLDELVSIQPIAKPQAIMTMNNQPAVEIDANFKKGYSLSTAIPNVKHLLQAQAPNLLYQFTGNAEAFLQGNHQTLFIVLLGISCIYLLLTILFESLADPFIILLTVPFSVVGGAISLELIHGSINLYSVMGFITLIGLITKHGVLIVQFANQKLAQGEKDVIQAVLLATHHRFRPIMMTTLAMTLGALPLALSHQLQFVAKQDLGVVIIGGLLIGTIFSLFIVPLVYSLIKRAEMDR